jgi:hypothetical protein
MPPWLEMRGIERDSHQIFAAALARCAAGSADPGDRRLARISRRAAAPLRVAVHGRRGVGVPTVRAALSAAGIDVVTDTRADGEVEADVDVLVVAEVAKPEDAVGRATLVVLNKADLTGFGPGGPIVAAQRRSAQVAELTGTPTEPLVALLAVAALDDSVLDEQLLDALRLLVDEPADLRSPDAFVGGAHRLPPAIRARLIESLDLFGIAHSVVTLRGDRRRAGAQEVRAELRRVSRIGEVIQRIDALAAEARYRRMLGVVDELQVLAITDREVAVFLAADDTVLARMTAAVDVVEGIGLTVDPSDEPAAHLRRAVHWRRYRAGPLTDLHRACAADIAGGSLRLLAAAPLGGSP